MIDWQPPEGRQRCVNGCQRVARRQGPGGLCAGCYRRAPHPHGRTRYRCDICLVLDGAPAGGRGEGRTHRVRQFGLVDQRRSREHKGSGAIRLCGPCWAKIAAPRRCPQRGIRRSDREQSPLAVAS